MDSEAVELHHSRASLHNDFSSANLWFPVELLLQIFLLSQDKSDISIPPDFSELPWVLGRVCSQWRTISRQEPYLWGRPLISIDLRDPFTSAGRVIDILPPDILIRIECGGPAKHVYPYFSRCERLCFEADMDTFDDMWKSVRQNALHNLREVRFVLYGSPLADTGIIQSEEHWEAAAEIFQNARNIHKAQFLRISDETCTKMFASLRLPWNQLSSLEVYSMDRCGTEDLWMLLHPYSPQPVSKSISSFDVPSLGTLTIGGILLPGILSENVWGRLNSLTVTQGFSLGQLQAILQQCSNLQSLRIASMENYQDGQPKFPIAPLQFPTLQFLSVNTDSWCLWRLDVNLIMAPLLNVFCFSGNPSDFLDAIRPFGSTLSDATFKKMHMGDAMTPLLRQDILSFTSSNSIRFTEK